MPLNVLLIFFQFVVLAFSLSFHEAAHAWMAMRRGDPTAYMLGRVTLNPLKQLTLLGSVVLPLIGMFSGVPLIGWAKPCPVTTRNFSNYRRDYSLTVAAGPLSNLLLASVSLIILVIWKHLPGGADTIISAVNIAFGETDFSPSALPPLFPLALLLFFGILTNVSLFLFNLIPIPPLDGSKILAMMLPYAASEALLNIGPYGMLVLYLVVSRTPLLSAIYQPVIGLFLRMLIAL